MKKLFLSLFCLLPFFLFSQQDWDLFPLGQETFFEVENEIRPYYCDSFYIENKVKKHLFGAKYLYETFGDCTDEILTEFWVNEELDYEIKIDTLSEDSLSYFSIIETDTLRFFPDFSVGENWEIPTAQGHSFRLSCVSVSEADILGFIDSLKRFEIQYLENEVEVSHPLNSFFFELSKSAGFTHFLPFSTLYFESEINEKHALLGFQKNTERYGYTSTFEDFFHYETGSILKWHTDYKSEPGVNFSRVEEWFLDTIQDVYIDGDFLKLDVTRTIYTEKSNAEGIYENYTETGIPAVFSFSKILIDSFLNTPIHHPTNFFTRLRYWRQSPTISTEIGILETADFITPKEYFLEDCSMGETGDLSATFSLSSDLGFTYTRLLYSEESYSILELLGYQSSNILWGELEDIYVNTDIVLPSKNISISPNPARAYIEISSSEKIQNATLILLDNTGKEVLRKENFRERQLDVSPLHEGFYYIILEKEKTRFYSKFVIVR